MPLSVRHVVRMADPAPGHGGFSAKLAVLSHETPWFRPDRSSKSGACYTAPFAGARAWRLSTRDPAPRQVLLSPLCTALSRFALSPCAGASFAHPGP
jgi:hypothetical protein